MKNSIAQRANSILLSGSGENTGLRKKNTVITQRLAMSVAAMGIAAFVSLAPTPSRAQAQSIQNTSGVELTTQSPSLKRVVLKQQHETDFISYSLGDLKSALYHNDAKAITTAKQQALNKINEFKTSTIQLSSRAEASERSALIGQRLVSTLDQLSETIKQSQHSYNQVDEVKLTELTATARGISSRLLDNFHNVTDEIEKEMSSPARTL